MNVGPAMRYVGAPPFGRLAVVVQYRDGTLEHLPHFVLHSPDGFSWGYAGSGTSELARCLLIDLVGARLADLLHVDLARDVLTPLNPDRPWTLTANAILTYVRNKAADRGIALEPDEEVCGSAAGHRLGVTCPRCGAVG